MTQPSPDPTLTIPFLDSSDRLPAIALRDVATGKVYPMPKRGARCVIGSSQHADIHLDDPYVSAVHCVIERPMSHRLVITDRGSKNGTHLDGHRISQADLRPGCDLRVGRNSLTVLSSQAISDQSADELLVGEAPLFREAKELARRVARSGDCSVLILGETGTGKELIARMIHECSRRAEGPFVTLNCGGLTSTLIASELFGHIRGAFTGARSDRPGVFVQADDGTLFLDEVGELPLEQQPHLLRALESGDIRPLGSTESRQVNVRFIAATNRLDLATRERLRTDLYHRLATIVIRLPPLRLRPNDIPLLIREFIRREGGSRHISVETMRALVAYPWHGNVRELRHAVKRALTLSAGELTLSSFLPELGDALPKVIEAASLRDPRSLYDDGVKQVLQAALMEYGSVRRAARALGLPKSTFADRARRLGVRFNS